MKITALEEYGLRCLVQLAREGAGPNSEAALSARAIAELEGLTSEYASQILASLRRAGLVKATRGVHGGYRLAYPASDVTVGQLFRALDGTLDDGICESYTGNLDECAHAAAGCSVAPIWRELTRRIYGFLDGITLADIADGSSRTMPQVVPLGSLAVRRKG